MKLKTLSFSNKHGQVNCVLHYKDAVDCAVTRAGATLNGKVLVKISQSKLTPERLKENLFLLVTYGTTKQQKCQTDWEKYIELVQEQSISISHWTEPDALTPKPKRTAKAKKKSGSVGLRFSSSQNMGAPRPRQA